MNRTRRAAIAAETLGILRDGSYVTTDGKSLNISGWLQQSMNNAVRCNSLESDNWLQQNDSIPVGSKRTCFTVVNQTTVQAAREICEAGCDKVGILNFASAKKPGGGFRTGARAQEESLAVSSGLYGTLTRFQDEYYDYHKGDPLPGLYSDNLIYSPDVVFFRNDDLDLVEPFRACVITCAAVNYGALRQAERVRAIDVMRTRVRKILHGFWLHGCTHLVLGAYGCGLFRNPVANVVAIFKDLLCGESAYKGVFEHIVFAVFHPDENAFLVPFQRAFLE